ncbi:MAG: hypothetical protein LBJ11_01100 [Oscillospiraceae bacterium]|jgi:uncharacterized membrane protein YvbJ|nr:hypothetical protein [Oscillospiraceae bacterium]
MERFCENCNAPQSETAKFCASCGTQTPIASVQPTQPIEPQYESPYSYQDNKSKSISVKQIEKRTIIGIVMLALGALGLGFMLATSVLATFARLLFALISFAIMLIGLICILKKERQSH